MICVNNDFFDDFSVVFQKDACVLNDCWYPLGSFAAEMLQLDETPWRQAIRSRLAVFKEEFAIFLSSRSASAAALSQRMRVCALRRKPLYLIFRCVSPLCRWSLPAPVRFPWGKK